MVTEGSVDPKNVAVFVVTLGVAVFGSILFRKFLGVIPILIAIVAGYVLAACLGMIDYSAIGEAGVLLPCPISSWPNLIGTLF